MSLPKRFADRVAYRLGYLYRYCASAYQGIGWQPCLHLDRSTALVSLGFLMKSCHCFPLSLRESGLSCTVPWHTCFCLSNSAFHDHGHLLPRVQNFLAVSLSVTVSGNIFLTTFCEMVCEQKWKVVLSNQIGK